MLLGFDANIACYSGAEVQKAANLETEFREILVVRLMFHESIQENIISCSDIIIAYQKVAEQCAAQGKMISFEKRMRRLQ